MHAAKLGVQTLGRQQQCHGRYEVWLWIASNRYVGTVASELRDCGPGSSGRAVDSGAASGSGGDGEAGTEEVGTPRTSARRLKGKRQRSNLGQPQIKASPPRSRFLATIRISDHMHAVCAAHCHPLLLSLVPMLNYGPSKF